MSVNFTCFQKKHVYVHILYMFCNLTRFWHCQLIELTWRTAVARQHISTDIYRQPVCHICSRLASASVYQKMTHVENLYTCIFSYQYWGFWESVNLSGTRNIRMYSVYYLAVACTFIKKNQPFASIFLHQYFLPSENDHWNFSLIHNNLYTNKGRYFCLFITSYNKSLMKQ